MVARSSLADKKLALGKVHTATNPADVCAKALPRYRICELCRLARVHVCYSEKAMENDSENWSPSQLDESRRCEKLEQTCDAESEGAC